MQGRPIVLHDEQQRFGDEFRSNPSHSLFHPSNLNIQQRLTGMEQNPQPYAGIQMSPSYQQQLRSFQQPSRPNQQKQRQQQISFTRADGGSRRGSQPNNMMTMFENQQVSESTMDREAKQQYGSTSRYQQQYFNPGGQESFANIYAQQSNQTTRRTDIDQIELEIQKDLAKRALNRHQKIKQAHSGVHYDQINYAPKLNKTQTINQPFPDSNSFFFSDQNNNNDFKQQIHFQQQMVSPLRFDETAQYGELQRTMRSPQKVSSLGFANQLDQVLSGNSPHMDQFQMMNEQLLQIEQQLGGLKQTFDCQPRPDTDVPTSQASLRQAPMVAPISELNQVSSIIKDSPDPNHESKPTSDHLEAPTSNLTSAEKWQVPSPYKPTKEVSDWRMIDRQIPEASAHQQNQITHEELQPSFEQSSIEIQSQLIQPVFQKIQMKAEQDLRHDTPRVSVTESENSQRSYEESNQNSAQELDAALADNMPDIHVEEIHQVSSEQREIEKQRSAILSKNEQSIGQDRNHDGPDASPANQSSLQSTNNKILPDAQQFIFNNSDDGNILQSVQVPTQLEAPERKMYPAQGNRTIQLQSSINVMSEEIQQKKEQILSDENSEQRLDALSSDDRLQQQRIGKMASTDHPANKHVRQMELVSQFEILPELARRNPKKEEGDEIGHQNQKGKGDIEQREDSDPANGVDQRKQETQVKKVKLLTTHQIEICEILAEQKSPHFENKQTDAINSSLQNQETDFQIENLPQIMVSPQIQDNPKSNCFAEGQFPSINEIQRTEPMNRKYEVGRFGDSQQSCPQKDFITYGSNNFQIQNESYREDSIKKDIQILESMDAPYKSVRLDETSEQNDSCFIINRRLQLNANKNNDQMENSNDLRLNVDIGENRQQMSSFIDHQTSQNKSLQAYGKVERQLYNSQIERSSRTTNHHAHKSPEQIYNNMMVNHDLSHQKKKELKMLRHVQRSKNPGSQGASQNFAETEYDKSSNLLDEACTSDNVSDPSKQRTDAKRGSSVVSRNSNAAREAALKIKCEQEGFQLLEVAYYFKNGKKKRKIKKKRRDVSGSQQRPSEEEMMIRTLLNTHSNQHNNEYTFSYQNPTERKRSSNQSQSYYRMLQENEDRQQIDSYLETLINTKRKKYELKSDNETAYATTSVRKMKNGHERAKSDHKLSINTKEQDNSRNVKHVKASSCQQPPSPIEKKLNQVATTSKERLSKLMQEEQSLLVRKPVNLNRNKNKNQIEKCVNSPHKPDLNLTNIREFDKVSKLDVVSEVQSMYTEDQSMSFNHYNFGSIRQREKYKALYRTQNNSQKQMDEKMIISQPKQVRGLGTNQKPAKRQRKKKIRLSNAAQLYAERRGLTQPTTPAAKAVLLKPDGYATKDKASGIDRAAGERDQKSKNVLPKQDLTKMQRSKLPREIVVSQKMSSQQSSSLIQVNPTRSSQGQSSPIHGSEKKNNQSEKNETNEEKSASSQGLPAKKSGQKQNDQTVKKIKSWSSLQQITGVPYPLHAYIIMRDYIKLEKVLSVLDPALLKEHIDDLDTNGNTALHLACRLAEFDSAFLQFVDLLFRYNANPKLKDREGWRIVDWAVGQQNIKLLAMIFDFMTARRKFKWERDKGKLLRRLHQIPNFYVQMHWQCQSDWIPFLSKIAPSDDFEIWKVGGNIRLDFSLVGFQKLSNKRRRMSMLIKETSRRDPVTGKLQPDFQVLLINKDKEIIINPMEDLEQEEKMAIITDMINSDPVASSINIKSQQWHEMHSIFGGQVSETIGNYKCLRFRINITAQAQKKHLLREQFTTEEFHQNQKQNEPSPQGKTKFSLSQLYLKKNLKSYFRGVVDGEAASGQEGEDNDNEITKSLKDIQTDLWLSPQFPLDFKQFMEVIHALSITENETLNKMLEFLDNQCLRDVVEQNGFPVQIQIPIGVIVKATVKFKDFMFLKQGKQPQCWDYSEIFSIPENYKRISRKEGMKIMDSKKKRLAVANMIT